MRVRLGRGKGVVLAMLGLLGAAAGPVPDDVTVVGGHAYRLPGAVFQGGVVERGKVSSILLQVMWPSMEGVRFADTLRTGAPESLVILGLANADGEPYTPEELAKGERQSIQVAVAEYGRPGFPLQAAPGPEHGPVPGGGMIAVEVHPDTAKDDLDVFVAPSLDAPAKMISCHRASGQLTNPQCKQEWASRGMALQVSYNRPMVARWREIEGAVERFLAAQEVRP